MNTSTLTFYINDLRSDKNMFIEQMDDYLASITSGNKRTITQFQYVKHNIDIEIKVDMDIGSSESPLDLDPATNFKYNYVSIKNSNENYKIYYYILNSEWRSNGCVKLALKMDSLNSFPQWINKFTDKTFIERCTAHDVSLNYNETTNYYQFPRVIDFVDEQLNPRLYKTYGTALNQYNSSDSYYLVYKAQYDLDDSGHSANPLSCKLYSKNASTEIKPKSIIVDPTDIRKDLYFYITTLGTNWYIGSSAEYVNEYIVGHEIEINGVGVIIDAISFKSILNTQSGYSFIIALIGHETIGGNDYYGVIDTETNNGQDLVIFNNSTQVTLKSSKTAVTTPSGVGALSSYAFGIQKLDGNVDVTDAKLVKIIEIPYLPILSESTTTMLQNDSKWSYHLGNGIGYWIFNNPSNEFSEVTICDVTTLNTAHYLQLQKTWFNNFNYLFKSSNDDSKIYNSSFYQVKIGYDSFGKEYPLELYSSVLEDDIPNLKYTFTFKMTSTINSTMGFKMTINNVDWWYPTEDYPDWMVVNRNNEKTIYTSNYLNYLRTGYNYDKKNKTLGELQSASGVAIGAVGGASQGGAIGAVVGALTGGANFVLNTIKTENAWSSKISQLKEQSLNVSGADDLDIFNAYASNKLHLYKYEVNYIVKSQLNHLFKYFGYARRQYGTPSTHTRTFWDYLQCNAVFSGYKVQDIEVASDIEDDVKLRLQNGVTIIHDVRNNESGEYIWDIQQEYNNLDKNVYDLYDL